MGNYMEKFEWIDFRQGRIQYAGGRRGREEPPITTFAVDLGGRIYYGEIKRLFLASGNNYNIEIVSFGWLKHDWVGTEPNLKHCSVFTLEELGKVQSLVCEALPKWRRLEDRPSFLTEYVDSRFTGEILFREGWALIKDDEDWV